MSKQQLDLAKSNYEAANASVDAAAANITQAEAQISLKEAAVTVAQTNLDYTVIRSPIDGAVVARNVDVGQTVAASLQAPTIFTIAQDLTKMWVYAKTDESDVDNIKVGKTVTFKVDALPKPTFQEVVSPALNPSSSELFTFFRILHFTPSACKLDVMRRNLVIAVLVLAACRSAAAQNASPVLTTFHWLDAAKDAPLFEQIRAALAEELRPDDPEKVKPVVAELYKKISRIGVFETSALVLIAERETSTSTYGDYFQVYSYLLKSGKKTPSEKGFMKWRFKKLVRFDSSKIPNIVFTYPSCTECEADFLLGSFHFDSTDATWKIRSWGEKDDAIVIGSDYSVGTEENSKDDCLFKFADFNGDGFDDLAVRCLVITEQGKILGDTTTIYTVQHGKPQVIAVKEARQLATVRDKLCTDVKKSRLCPPK